MSQGDPDNGNGMGAVPSAPTEGLPEGLLAPGQVLGDRYQIRSQLGRGGMGEVWRAFDLKLRVEVALKALLPELFKDEKRRETLRREVRAAREVVSPNVCRIFDLIEVDGRELVSMEYVDGGTLLGVLHERGPLDLKEAQDIASQFLAGLEAIHQAGLVHRDVKPENIMITRAGRVVLMDFGLARQEDSSADTISGTPAYMAPEQAAGLMVDARADVYSAGVVLAEMVSPHGIKSFESRQSVWEGIRHEPARVPDSPWAPVLRRAVAKEPDQRYDSAHTLTRALEEVTLRVEGAEDVNPYPGLASFTEEDAEFFFGREAEIEAVWRRLESAHLLAIVGPSGAGKSSFIGAGLVPNAPAGWAIVRCTPGNAAMASLARAMAREMAGDADAVELVVGIDDPAIAVDLFSRWRRRHDQALLIVDQFEELFTLNSPEHQQRFAELLGGLALEADVRVLLSMRDDFLMECKTRDALVPVFESLTPLMPPIGLALRRALVQPATKCGYRFEDNELVDEMLAEVESERGALPLLAFSMSRLWDKRDRDHGLLTRQAYEDIGGVGGALARHAEATIDRIGAEHIAVVRELFRNLVTAEGTRAVREWDELLSVFEEPQQQSAEEVLSELIDARLLTAYEIREEDREPTRRIEIIHESLLANWPRLVRWQTQDQEGAQLRDELRQAARAWDEHERHKDRLWTGTAFREYQLWRDRYPGGLTELEEGFSRAMTLLATRRRRRRRAATAAALVTAIVIAAVFGALWRRSVLESRRADAAKLLALAQLRFDEDPTEALAFTAASLELADTREARILAMKALWEAPPAFEIVGGGSVSWPAFSPDGKWLAAGGAGEVVGVWAENGERRAPLPGHELTRFGRQNIASWASAEYLVTGLIGVADRAQIWSFPTGEKVRTIEFGGPSSWHVGPEHLFADTLEETTDPGREIFVLRSWRLPDGEAQELGRVDWTALGASSAAFEPNGAGWLYTKGSTIFFRPLPADGRSDQVVSRHDSTVNVAGYWGPDGVMFREESGRYHAYCSSSDGRLTLAQSFPKPETAPKRIFPERSGRWLVNDTSDESRARLWGLETSPVARPLVLRRNASWGGSASDFHPKGNWLVVSTNSQSNLTFWPLRRTYPMVVDGYAAYARPLAFTPDSQSLVTSWSDLRSLRLWPVGTGMGQGPRLLELPQQEAWLDVSVEGRGHFLFVVSYSGGAYVVPLDGGPVRRLEGFSDQTSLCTAAVSPSGRRVATAFGIGDGENALRVWDLDSGEQRRFELPEGSRAPARDEDPTSGRSHRERAVHGLAFVGERTLYSGGDGGIRRWNLDSGTHELVFAVQSDYGLTMRLGAQGRTALIRRWPLIGQECLPADIVDLGAGTARKLPAFGECVDAQALALDASGTVAVTGDREGVIRVGRLGNGEPHLLIGHAGTTRSVAISPDLRWVASAGEDNTLRLWPMPDLDKPPLHTLPREELIAKLKTLTNLRVVRDAEASTGWKLTHDPFPGWAEAPEW